MKSSPPTIERDKSIIAIQPELNHRLLADAILRQVSKGKLINIRQAMLEVGYSESYSHHAERIKNSPSFQALMARFLNDDLLTSVHLELLFNKNWKARERALDMAYKLKKRFGTGEGGLLGGASIKNLLVQIYNDKRPLINEENAQPNRSGVREELGDTAL